LQSQGDTLATARSNLAKAIEIFLETAPAAPIKMRLRGEV
jgi:predicted RNase H-like HicB family nuclease